MAHHKRRRPKHQRAGCLFCKPHKDERVSNAEESLSGLERKARFNEREQRRELREFQSGDNPKTTC